MTLHAVFWHGLSAARCALTILCCVVALPEIRHSAALLSSDYDLAQRFFLPFLVWLGVIGLIAAALFYRDAVAAYARPYAAILRTLGLSTYPFYLLHYHVGAPILVEALGRGAPAPVAICVAFFDSVAVALIVTTSLEPPSHKIVAGALKRILKPPRSTDPPTAPPPCFLPAPRVCAGVTKAPGLRSKFGGQS